MKWETAKADHIGGRDEQQDRVEVFASREGKRRLLVLADGMGGHRGGALAAQAVVDTARRVWEAHDEKAGEPRALLEEIVRESHAAINAIGEEKKLTPRSTGVLLYTDTERAYWATIGDSRLYRFQETDFVERSRDHSVVQMLVDIGKIGEEEMGTHPDQNRLTQSLGGEVDPEPTFGDAAIEPGTGFLLCSDGLWEMVSPEEMGEALLSGSLSRAARDLAEAAAKRAGTGSDNVSVALARYGQAEGAERRRVPWFAVPAVAVTALIAALLAVFLIAPDESPTGVGNDAAGEGETRHRDEAGDDAGRARSSGEESDSGRGALGRPEGEPEQDEGRTDETRRGDGSRPETESDTAERERREAQSRTLGKREDEGKRGEAEGEKEGDDIVVPEGQSDRVDPEREGGEGPLQRGDGRPSDPTRDAR